MEKYILSEMQDRNYAKAVNEIYLLTDYNKKQYPEYYKWYFGKTIPRVITGTGEILFYLDGFNVIGLTILKNTSDEKKLCTFMINEDYRKKGYSMLLLEDSFKILGTEKPLITIPKYRLDEFKKIIDVYGWQESYISGNYYSPEVVFNDKVKKLIK